MPDNKVTVQGFPKISLRVYDSNPGDDEELQKRNRRLAVEAALELIRAEALSTRERVGSTVANNLSALSEYADKIEEAMRIKRKE